MITIEAAPIDDLQSEIMGELRAESEAGIKAASELIPDFIRENIDSFGVNLNGNPWPRVSLKWLRMRQSWPDKGSKGKLTAGQESYLKAHVPLRDTDGLYRSFRVVNLEVNGDEMQADIGTDVEYGFFHNEGLAKAGGPLNLPRRAHMALNEDQVTEIDLAFEGAFE